MNKSIVVLALVGAFCAHQACAREITLPRGAVLCRSHGDIMVLAMSGGMPQSCRQLDRETIAETDDVPGQDQVVRIYPPGNRGDVWYAVHAWGR